MYSIMVWAFKGKEKSDRRMKVIRQINSFIIRTKFLDIRISKFHCEESASVDMMLDSCWSLSRTLYGAGMTNKGQIGL